MDLNPDEMRRFAKHLRNAVAAMRDGRGVLDRDYRVLGETWRDTRYQAFSRLFDQTMPVIERFCRDAEAYAAGLEKKAAAVDAYLGRR
jgi:hypothetical protein